MPQKSDRSPVNIADVLDKMSAKGFALNFDVTLELNTPDLHVGSLRIHGRVESAPRKR